MTTFSSGAESLKVRVEYDTVRSLLSDDRYAERRRRPLAYWALPSDRGLPFALLDRPLDDLLHNNFEQIAATPRVGLRKLKMLVTLMQRAAVEEPSAQRILTSNFGIECHTNGEFDPSLVSELHWSQWCETLRRHSLDNEPLGRLAPSLQLLPSVIWRTSVKTYLFQSLADIRDLKTHGEKRVWAVLYVFYSAHQLLSGAPPRSRFSFRLVPQFIALAEDTIRHFVERSDSPTEAEIRQGIVLPVLNQLDLDAGTQVQQLVADRLGLESSPKPVREQALSLGITRARVYQLFETCEEIVKLRWPAINPWLTTLLQQAEAKKFDDSAVQILRRLQDLFCPTSKCRSEEMCAGESDGAEGTAKLELETVSE